jgi:hypothetical protein
MIPDLSSEPVQPPPVDPDRALAIPRHSLPDKERVGEIRERGPGMSVCFIYRF